MGIEIYNWEENEMWLTDFDKLCQYASNYDIQYKICVHEYTRVCATFTYFVIELGRVKSNTNVAMS